MSAINRLTKPSHLINMEDIIREGHPTLRDVATEVDLPLSDQDIILGEKMLQFLKNSQDPVTAENMGLRGGVGLAATQLDVKKRILAVLVPNEENASSPDKAYALEEIMFNPKIISHSIQEAALEGGEGCLSVDRPVEGYVVRYARITVSFLDKHGNQHTRKFKGFHAIVVQHEIDHLNGVMFYDRINPEHPLAIKDGLLIIE